MEKNVVCTVVGIIDIVFGILIATMPREESLFKYKFATGGFIGVGGIYYILIPNAVSITLLVVSFVLIALTLRVTFHELVNDAPPEKKKLRHQQRAELAKRKNEEKRKNDALNGWPKKKKRGLPPEDQGGVG